LILHSTPLFLVTKKKCNFSFNTLLLNDGSITKFFYIHNTKHFKLTLLIALWHINKFHYCFWFNILINSWKFSINVLEGTATSHSTWISRNKHLLCRIYWHVIMKLSNYNADSKDSTGCPNNAILSTHHFRKIKPYVWRFINETFRFPEFSWYGVILLLKNNKQT